MIRKFRNNLLTHSDGTVHGRRVTTSNLRLKIDQWFLTSWQDQNNEWWKIRRKNGRTLSVQHQIGVCMRLVCYESFRNPKTTTRREEGDWSPLNEVEIPSGSKLWVKRTDGVGSRGNRETWDLRCENSEKLHDKRSQKE